MVVGFVAFENFVEPLEEECPEPVERTVVTDTLGSVSGIMVVWPHDLRAVQLGHRRMVSDSQN